MRTRLQLVGAVAAIAGGVMWIGKGGVILAVGDQPPLLFEVPGLLFPVALIGLHSRLDGEGGRPARAGGVLARLAAAVAVAVATYAILVSDPSEAVLGVGISLCGLATVAGLFLLGCAARSVGALPWAFRNLPVAMGAAAVPAMSVIGGILEALHERLLELPIVAYGVAWALLGRVLWSPRDATERRERATAAQGPAGA